MPQQDNYKQVAITIPAPRSVPGKTPHRCFWHDDQHPSAVTFFYEDGKCLTFCSAEGRKEWGRYEISGGMAYIYPTGSTRPRTFVARAYNDQEREAEKLFVAFCHSVYKKEKARPISSLRQDDFWYIFLESKRVDVRRAALVENPPLVISVGILFPAHIYCQGQFVPHSWQLRTVGIKSISLWKTGEGHHYYIPSLSELLERPRFFVVESPFVALRLSYLGAAAIATFGKLDRYDEISRMFSPAIPIFINDEPGMGQVVQDLDMLSDEEIQRLLIPPTVLHSTYL